MAEDDDEMFMTRSLNVMPKTTEQHLIVLSYKYVAYVNIYIYIYIFIHHIMVAQQKKIYLTKVG